MKHCGHHYHRREWFLLGLVAGLLLGVLLFFLYVPIMGYLLDRQTEQIIQQDVVPAPSEPEPVIPEPAPPVPVKPSVRKPVLNSVVVIRDPVIARPPAPVKSQPWCGGAYRTTIGTNFGSCPSA